VVRWSGVSVSDNFSPAGHKYVSRKTFVDEWELAREMYGGYERIEEQTGECDKR